MDFSEVIKKILIDEDMTISDLAKRLDVTQQNISAKLKKNDPRISEINKIADVLGYDVEIKFFKRK